MKLIVTGSSSKGNGYILHSSAGETLLIEAGVKIEELMKVLKFNLNGIVGCLVSHEHGDHAKYAKQYRDYGIQLYMSDGTRAKLHIPLDYKVQTLYDKLPHTISNGFKVIPFKIQHDAAEPLGFLVNHPESGNILFATDTYYLSQKFKNLHNIMIEANYSEPILQDNVENGRVSPGQRERTMFSHFSLENCIKTLNANDLTQVNNIVLIHLSDNNSHAAEFRCAVEKATGKTVFVAEKNMKINFDKTPF